MPVNRRTDALLVGFGQNTVDLALNLEPAFPIK